MKSHHGLLFHSQISKVDERLYLGDLMDSQNKTLLNRLGITHILNMAKECPCFHPEHFTYMHVPGIDIETCDLKPHLEKAADFVAHGIKEGGVLVHCAYGISRGPSGVISYLVKHKHMGVEEAQAFISKARPHISPNSGFVKQLKALQKKLGVISGPSKAARLRKEAEEMSSDFFDLGLGAKEPRFDTTISNKKPQLPSIGKKFDPLEALNRIKAKIARQDEELAEFRQFAGNMGVSFNVQKVQPPVTTNSWKLSRVPPSGSQPPAGHIADKDSLKQRQKSLKKPFTCYCCKRCGTKLAGRSDVLPHGTTPTVRCDTIFLRTALDWMGRGDSMGGGRKLHCPNPLCVCVVGRTELQGMQCVCGYGDNPAWGLAVEAVRKG